jgi:hypothetical protein
MLQNQRQIAALCIQWETWRKKTAGLLMVNIRIKVQSIKILSIAMKFVREKA